jgi:hypothetical protein
MKRLHRKDLYGWSKFQESLNLDFNSVLWVRPEGSVAVDPLPLSEHDLAHVRQLGGVAFIVITNSAHLRAAAELKAATGALILGPSAEREKLTCDRYLADGEAVVPGLIVRELHGSKTPGELALILEDSTLISGDLVRAHSADTLSIGPEPKLVDKTAAIASLRRLAELHPRLEAILVGDGWSVFRDGAERLNELLEAPSVRLETTIPILPSTNLERSSAFFQRLGFTQRGVWPGQYLIMQREKLELHFTQCDEIDLKTTVASCFLRVKDSTALWTEWTKTSLPQDCVSIPRLQGPPDADGEFALIDDEGTLFRVGI